MKIIYLLLTSLFLTVSCSKDDATDTDPVVVGGIPTVTTKTTFDAQFSATPVGGGNVTSDGGSPVLARGIVWSKNQNPTVADSKTFDSAGLGTFTSTMTGLTSNTKYYVRAYATNAKGVAYGNETSITTVNFTVDSTPALMTANIDGVQYNNMKPLLYSFLPIDVRVENNGAPAGEPRFLWIQGDTSDDLDSLTEINLRIPNIQWKAGTYPLTQLTNYEVAYCQVNMGIPGDKLATVTGGSVTVTEFNLVTKRIKGTFKISYKKSGSATIYEVKNGTFNYGLDADYFN
mgnify:CR=1 FL=1